MRRTMAQVLEEKGRQKGRKEEAVRSRQQTLLRQLRRRFGEVSPTVQQTIEATKDIAHLDAWLDQVVTARSWENMDIGPTV